MIYLSYNGKVEIKNDEDSSGTYTVVERVIEPKQQYFDPTKPVSHDAMTKTHTKKLPVYRIPLIQGKIKDAPTHAFFAAETIEEALEGLKTIFGWDKTSFDPSLLLLEVDAKRSRTNNLIIINLWANCRLVATSYFDDCDIRSIPVEHFLDEIKNTLEKIIKLFGLEKEWLEDFFTEVYSFAEWCDNRSADVIEHTRMATRFYPRCGDISGLLKYYIEDNHPLA